MRALIEHGADPSHIRQALVYSRKDRFGLVLAGVGEVSIYIDLEATGRGIGTILLEGLIQASEKAGIWTALQTGIFPREHRSLRLFKRSGFRLVGTREKVGRMAGRWRACSCWNGAAR